MIQLDDHIFADGLVQPPTRFFKTRAFCCSFQVRVFVASFQSSGLEIQAEVREKYVQEKLLPSVSWRKMVVWGWKITTGQVQEGAKRP